MKVLTLSRIMLKNGQTYFENPTCRAILKYVRLFFTIMNESVEGQQNLVSFSILGHVSLSGLSPVIKSPTRTLKKFLNVSSLSFIRLSLFNARKSFFDNKNKLFIQNNWQ